MYQRVYISADYDYNDGDRDVVDQLNKWSEDKLHDIKFTDMSQVASGSVSEDPDCRACDLKHEFNQQINASSATIFIIGDKTATRMAGSYCERATKDQLYCSCTPYKHNASGERPCKVYYAIDTPIGGDIGNINSYSYLRHEFEQTKARSKKMIIVYNSIYREPAWLPSYLRAYESIAKPFWTRNFNGDKVGNYGMIKQELGYD